MPSITKRNIKDNTMKKNICTLIVLFFDLLLFSQERPQYKTLSKTYFYHFQYDKYIETSTLDENEKIFLESNWFLLFNEKIYASNGKISDEINIDAAIPSNTKDLFDKELISTQGKDYEWIPIYYLDILKQQKGLLLRTYEPDIPEIIDESDYGQSTWKDRFDIEGYLKIYNAMLGIGYGNGCTDNMACDLNIINIEKKENGYNLTVANGLALQEYMETSHSDWLYGKMPSYKDYTPYKIEIRFDGDYSKLFLNNENNLIQTFFKVDKSTQEAIVSLIKTGKCNLTKVTWPRHADGSCDYGVYLE